MLAFQAGAEAAFERIVLHYQSTVRRFIGRYTRDRDRAEDLAQEAFLRVYQARGRYQPTAGFKTWLFTIVTRLCLNDLRSRRREGRVIARLPRAPSGGEEEEMLACVADRRQEAAEELLLQKELEEAIDAAILELPPSQRAAILLLKLEELSYQEIAQTLEVSVMAVKSLINRGREALRSKLAHHLRAGRGHER
jgi:RNA polymerase sigma-70 factor (ECF subfamily)